MGDHEAALQNEPVDVSEEFARQQNHFFIGSKVAALDPETASGMIHWKGMALKQRVSYRGAAIPHARLAQSTDQIDWSRIELVVYGTEPAESLFCLPEDGTVHHLRLEPEEDGFVLSENPLEGRVEWNVRTAVAEGGPDA